MTPFTGPVWEALYRHYGTGSSEFHWTIYPHFNTTCIYTPLKLLFQHVNIPEVQEMSRIGVELNVGMRALIQIFCEKKDSDTLTRLVIAYRYNLMWATIGQNNEKMSLVQLIELIFDAGFREVFTNRAFRTLFSGWPTMLRDVRRVGDDLWTRCFESIFSYRGTANCLGLLVGSATDNFGRPTIRLDIASYFLELGLSAYGPFQQSPLSLALLRFQPFQLIELMAKHNVDFRMTSSLNRLGIPDALFVSTYYNHNLVFYILKIGGLCMRIPVEVAALNNVLEWLNGSMESAQFRRFVCCELNLFRGLLHLMSEFCLVLPLCDECKSASGLESSIPSLQSICRMTYRSQLSSSQLLRGDLDFPLYYPEFYCDYMLFKTNPYDSAEFYSAVAERNPQFYRHFANYVKRGFLMVEEEEEEL